MTLRWRRGLAYFAHESLCNCSVVEVFQPVVVAGLSNFAGATSILAFAWLALLWRSRPAAFAHKFARACSVVEVLLPVLFTRLVEFTTSAFVLRPTLPWRRGPAALAEELVLCARGFRVWEVLQPEFATKFDESAPAASKLLRLFRRWALSRRRRPTDFAQERAAATVVQFVLEKLAARFLSEALAAREE